VFHWPLQFPQVFARGGFDCVLGNPPWERIKLQEEEFFATRNPLVGEARNKAERAQRIDWLAHGQLAANLYPDIAPGDEVSAAERRLYREFIKARRTAEAASVYMHVKGDSGGRFPLTGCRRREYLCPVCRDHGSDHRRGGSGRVHRADGYCHR
jgi:hypothetical protein